MENKDTTNKFTSYFVNKLEHWATSKPNAIYLTQPHAHHIIEHSWLDVWQNCQKVAKHLSIFPRGSKIAIYSENCAHWIMADMAIQMAGLVSVPLYTTYAKKTTNDILIHCDAKAIFVGKLKAGATCEFIPKTLKQYCMHSTHDNMIPWDSLLASNVENISKLIPIQDDEIATIIYTSGTTSKPKGVCLKLSALRSSNQLVRSVIATQEDDRFFSYLPLAHISERTVTDLTSIAHGTPVYFLSHINYFKSEIRKIKPTIFFSAPQFWIKLKLMSEESMGGEANLKRLLNIPFFGKKIANMLLRKMGLDHVRFAICASAPVPLRVLEWFDSIGLKINQAYGLTETCGLSHIMRQSDTLTRSVGQVIEGCEVKLTPANEVLLRNPALITSYYNDESLTKEHLDNEGWLHTGDIGKIDSDGFLYLLGRKCDSFKTMCGKYVMPTPIEQDLQRIIDIDYIIVLDVGLDHPVVVLSVFELHEVINEVQMLLDCLNAFDQVNSNLDEHEKISHIFISDEPWTTESGYLSSSRKMIRKNLHDHYLPLIKEKLFENQNNRGTVLWFDK